MLVSEPPRRVDIVVERTVPLLYIAEQAGKVNTVGDIKQIRILVFISKDVGVARWYLTENC